MEFYIYDSMLEMWLTQKADTYTSDIESAGRFSYAQSVQTVTEANNFMGGRIDTSMQPIERRAYLRAA